MNSILLIEDDAVHITMYSSVLTKAGYTVHVAENGADGIKQAFLLHPDLIILDLHMPVLDGIETLKLLREDEWGNTVPVIILTNMSLSHEGISYLKSKRLHAYLIKTQTTPKLLLQKIESVFKPMTPLN